MKKNIFTYCFSLAALLMLAPMALAQDVEGIVAHKSVTPMPDENGVYWITLDTYVTGTVTVQTISKPADIILVLDVSSSMDNKDYYSSSEGYFTLSQVTYDELNETDNYYYIKNDGEYYELMVERSGSGGGPGGNRQYRFYFTKNGSEITVQATSRNETYTSTTEYPLYIHRTAGYISRIDALKESVQGFLDVVYSNDSTSRSKDENYLGDRVAIISYATSTYDISGGWQQVSSSISSLKTATAEMSTHNGTRSDKGLEDALTLLASARDTSNKTVVMFTDGCPSTSGSYAFTGEYARDAVNFAYDIKDGYGATVFTIGLFNTNASEWSGIANLVYDYMNYISSNYPKAQATSGSGTGSSASVTYTTGTGTWNGDYFQMAGEDDLSSIFEAIAQQSGGTDYDLSETSLVDVDVVSSSFSLPSGDLANAGDSIRIYVAQCIEYDSEGKPSKFAEEEDWIYVPNNGDDVPNFADVDNFTYNTETETFTFNHGAYNESVYITTGGVDGNEITTSGFNFGKNWCGRHNYKYKDANGTEHNVYYADGYKLIVKIPIVVNETAVGGAGTNTNEAGSGIYLVVDGVKAEEPLVKFPRPTVNLPTNIWIKKYGLNKGESAKFTVQRIEVGKDSTVAANWSDYTSVIITGTGETETQTGGDVLVSPTAKLNGLSSDYYYRVIEADDEHKSWSWSYNSTALDPVETYKLEKNPIRFSNSKTEASKSIHHAESKAINVFGTEKSAKTIDSREFFNNSSE